MMVTQQSYIHGWTHLMSRIYPHGGERRAGSHTSVDYSKLDFDAFMAFKKFRLRKDTRLKDHLKELTVHHMHGRDLATVLDVGTGDGELIFEVLSQARRSSTADVAPPLVHLTCLEPTAQGVDLLRGLSAQRRTFGLSSRVHQSTVQAYLRQASERRFDLITCIHSLYHIPWDDWGKVFEGLRQQLKAGGKLVVIMASNEGLLYKPLRVGADLLSSDRLYSEYGLDLFAEDLTGFLESVGMPYSLEAWDAPLIFTAEEVSEAIADPNIGLTRQQTSIVSQVLSFLYRTDVMEVQTVLDDEIKSMLRACLQPDGTAIVPMHEACISIEA
jgi:SAM-dependent methyltransferase